MQETLCPLVDGRACPPSHPLDVRSSQRQSEVAGGVRGPGAGDPAGDGPPQGGAGGSGGADPGRGGPAGGGRRRGRDRGAAAGHPPAGAAGEHPLEHQRSRIAPAEEQQDRPAGRPKSRQGAAKQHIGSGGGGPGARGGRAEPKVSAGGLALQDDPQGQTPVEAPAAVGAPGRRTPSAAGASCRRPIVLRHGYFKAQVLRPDEDVLPTPKRPEMNEQDYRTIGTDLVAICQKIGRMSVQAADRVAGRALRSALEHRLSLVPEYVGAGGQTVSLYSHAVARAAIAAALWQWHENTGSLPAAEQKPLSLTAVQIEGVDEFLCRPAAGEASSRVYRGRATLVRLVSRLLGDVLLRQTWACRRQPAVGGATRRWRSWLMAAMRRRRRSRGSRRSRGGNYSSRAAATCGWWWPSRCGSRPSSCTAAAGRRSPRRCRRTLAAARSRPGREPAAGRRRLAGRGGGSASAGSARAAARGGGLGAAAGGVRAAARARTWRGARRSRPTTAR